MKILTSIQLNILKYMVLNKPSIEEFGHGIGYIQRNGSVSNTEFRLAMSDLIVNNLVTVDNGRVFLVGNKAALIVALLGTIDNYGIRQEQRLLLEVAEQAIKESDYLITRELLCEKMMYGTKLRASIHALFTRPKSTLFEIVISKTAIAYLRPKPKLIKIVQTWTQISDIIG